LWGGWYGGAGICAGGSGGDGASGDDPRDLLKLYLYGYLRQIRSSRRLEAECQRNIELLWLLAAVGSGSQVDFFADVSRMHGEAVSQTGRGVDSVLPAAWSCLRGEWGGD